MPEPKANAMFGRPEWLHSFQAWVAGLSSATLADVIDVLAGELRERDVGDHDALGKVAETVRVHHATRVQQLVDAFAVVEPRRALPGRLSGPI